MAEETKKTTVKEKAAPVAKPATAKVATAKPAPAKAPAVKPSSEKTSTKKSKGPRMHHNRIVVESNKPLYNAQHKKGSAPYVISKQEVKVTLIKSTIGCIKVQKATVEALGLRKIGQSKIFKKSPALDGMLFRVRHLIMVEDIKGGKA